MTRHVVLFAVLAVLVAQAGVAAAQDARNGAASDARSPGESDQAYAYRTYATAGAAGSLSKAVRVYKALGSKDLKRSHRWLQIAAAGYDPAYFVDLQTAVTGDTPRVVVKSTQGGVDDSAMDWEFDCATMAMRQHSHTLFKADGSVLGKNTVLDSWGGIHPKSLNETILKFSCAP